MHKHVLDIWACYQDCLTLLVFIISQIVVNRENATEKILRGGVGLTKEVLCVFVLLTFRARETLTSLVGCVM